MIKTILKVQLSNKTQILIIKQPRTSLLQKIIQKKTSKPKSPEKKSNNIYGTLFNWIIIGTGLTVLFLIVINYSTISDTNASNSNFENTVKPGVYIGLFSGHKQGGPQRHPWLVNYLRENTIYNHFNIWCIQGLDKTQNSSIEINEYRKKNPRYKITEMCEESSEVLIGPFNNRESMRNFFHYNKMGNIDLHLYETFYECNYTCEKITY